MIACLESGALADQDNGKACGCRRVAIVGVKADVGRDF
jgi:hypothetical protein